MPLLTEKKDGDLIFMSNPFTIVSVGLLADFDAIESRKLKKETKNFKFHFCEDPQTLLAPKTAASPIKISTLFWV